MPAVRTVTRFSILRRGRTAGPDTRPAIVWGLDHSFDDSPTSCSPANDGRPGAYSDGWDIMSFACYGGLNPMFTNADTFGASGPGVNAHYRDSLGWIPGDRIQEIGSSQRFRGTVTLACLDTALAQGPLTVKLFPFPDNRSEYYTRSSGDGSDGIRAFPGTLSSSTRSRTACRTSSARAADQSAGQGTISMCSGATAAPPSAATGGTAGPAPTGGTAHSGSPQSMSCQRMASLRRSREDRAT